MNHYDVGFLNHFDYARLSRTSIPNQPVKLGTVANSCSLFYSPAFPFPPLLTIVPHTLGPLNIQGFVSLIVHSIQGMDHCASKSVIVVEDVHRFRG